MGLYNDTKSEQYKKASKYFDRIFDNGSDMTTQEIAKELKCSTKSILTAFSVYCRERARNKSEREKDEFKIKKRK